MRRLLIALLCLADFTVPSVRGDAFDHYVNPLLVKVPTAEGTQELKKLTPELITEHARVLPNLIDAFVVVKTNDGRWSKLLVQAARQKVNETASIPAFLIERFVTYKEGQERTVKVAGQNVTLFNGFRYSLDIGQVVPEDLGGDLRFVSDKDQTYLEPLGKAQLYLVTKPLPDATPKKTARFVPGETFEPRFFGGSYKLYDDGRRSGQLTLIVADDGEVTGSFYSDKDGQKYEVKGKVGTPKHAIQFSIRFPKVEENFQGWIFTGDARALAGTSRMLEREAGFYAARIEE